MRSARVRRCRPCERARGVTEQTVAVAQKASDLISSSRPQKALELLEPELKTHRDPGLLALAGVAAWRSDDSRLALEYWRASLDIAPSPEVEKLYRQVERESKNDQSTERLYGLRVLLRYESSIVPTETARQMTTVLDQEFIRISQHAGLQRRRARHRHCAEPRCVPQVHRLGGMVRGAVRRQDSRAGVRPEGSGSRACSVRWRMRPTHACLTMLGHWPAWLQEGIAQKLSGDSLSPAQMKKITSWVHEGKLPRLSNLRQDWSRLDADHAAVAYALSLAAVELLWQDSGDDGVRNLLRNPDRLPQVTAELDRKLGL